MSFFHLTVRGMLIAMTAFFMLAMLALAGGGLVNIQRLDDALLQVSDTALAIRRQMDADMMHDAIRSDVLAALLAVNLGQTEKIPEIRKDLIAHSERLKLNIINNAKADLGDAVRKQSLRTEPSLERYVVAARDVVTAISGGGRVDAEKIAEFEKDFDQLEIEMEKLSNLIQEGTDSAKNNARERVDGGKLSTLFILLVAIASFGLFARFVFGRVVPPLAALAATAQNIRDSGDLTLRAPATSNNEIGRSVQAFNALIDNLQSIVREVRGNSEQIHRYGQLLANAAQDTSNASENQSSAASGMAASMEELSVSIDSMSEHAQIATRASADSGQLAGEGVSVVRQAGSEIQRIAESVRETSDAIQILGGKTDEITQIVSVIREIADQTNLLALNAAIEAARAGEQGRGFAVVADEVRKLAERTAKSTGEISIMISEIQQGAQHAVQAMDDGVKRVSEGVERASHAELSVERVSASARESADAVSVITQSLLEQSAAGRAIARNVEQVAQLSERLHATAMDSAEQARSLARLAEALEAGVSRFSV